MPNLYPTTPKRAEAPPRRATALDALRGASILLMVLSANVPWNLPLGVERWLVHAQTPPPSHMDNPSVAGINAIDLVFPFFLFCLGAAVPIALSRRLAKGVALHTIVGHVLWRGLLLALFAFYIAHVRPWALSDNPTPGAWLRGIAAYLIVFPVFLRLPDKWPLWGKATARCAGWSAALAMVLTARFPDGTGPLPPNAAFIPHNDIVMWILSNVTVSTSLAWLATRRSPVARLGVMAALLAVNLAGAVPGGWVQAAWNWKPAPLVAIWEHATRLPWLWENGYLMMMLVTIPGTIVGEAILPWLNASRTPSEATGAWTPLRFSALFLVALSIVTLVVWGLFTRSVVCAVAAYAALGAAGLGLLSGAQTDTERLIGGIFRWGMFWLGVGLILEPYQGGIKKEPATLSYYFVTAGLACLSLLALMVVMDVFGKQRGLQLLADAGQNPLMAYIGFSNFVQPALILIGVTAFVNTHVASAWGQLAYTIAGTVLMAYLVGLMSRRGIYWRA